MRGMYHGDEFLPVGYGGGWESFKAWTYTYVPGINLAARVFSRESLPCMIAFGNKLRKMEAAATTGDRDAKRLYTEIRKREKRVTSVYWKEGGPAFSRTYKDFCKFLDSAFVEWEAKTKKREEQEFERMLDTYDPASGGASPIAPSMPGTGLAVQQTGTAPAAGGISTTTLLMAGAGALLLVALLKKKGGEKAAGSRFEGF